MTLFCHTPPITRSNSLNSVHSVPHRKKNQKLNLAPWVVTHIKDTSSDRYIQARKILGRPGIATYDMRMPSEPKDQAEERFRKKLNVTIFDSEKNPWDFPKLRLADPLSPKKFDRAPCLKTKETYHTQKKELSLPGLEDSPYIYPIAYSPETDRLAVILRNPVPNASGIIQSQVYIYDFKKENFQILYPENTPLPSCSFSRPLSCAFNKKGNLLALGKADGTLEIWSCKKGQVPEKKMQIQCGPAPIKTLAFSKRLIFAGNQIGDLFVVDLKAKYNWEFLVHKNSIYSITPSSNERFLITTGKDCKSYIIDTMNFDVLGEIQTPTPVRAVAFDPLHGPHIALGTKVWFNDVLLDEVRIYNFLDVEKPPLRIPMDSEITNIIWEKDRLFTTHKDGSYHITPLALHRKHPFGDTYIMNNIYNNSILFAKIRKGREKNLLLAGVVSKFSETGNEIKNPILKIFDLPNEQTKEIDSIFDLSNKIR